MNDDFTNQFAEQRRREDLAGLKKHIAPVGVADARQQLDALAAKVRAVQDRHDAAVRADAYREAAGTLDDDARRLADRDPRAAEVLTGAAYLLRTRAATICPQPPEEPRP